MWCDAANRELTSPLEYKALRTSFLSNGPQLEVYELSYHQESIKLGTNQKHRVYARYAYGQTKDCHVGWRRKR